MSKLQIIDMKGTAAGEFDVADELMALKKGAQAVHDVIVAQQASRRAGTASTLGKGAVAGSNKKPWRQKGTGRARAGYRRSPVWRGGGVAHGPHPHGYERRVPKKVARLAFRHAFGRRASAGDVKILSELTLSDAKTKTFAAMAKALGVKAGALFVVDRLDEKVALASRNLPGIELATARNVSTYQILRYPLVFVTRPAMDELKTRLEGGAGRAA